ncbi:hypothetical protein JCM11491_004245 [Sporobolomyces phaffii]
MSLTTDQNKLFRSDAQHRQEAIREARTAALQNVGDPIPLPSKPLRVVVQQYPGKEADAFVAESGFILRRVGLESGKTKQIFRGHSGPVTSLDFYTTRTSKRQLLISGSWDRSIRVWDLQTKMSVSTTIGHTDFIKTLLVIPELDALVTGSSDKDLRIWDLTTLDSFDFSGLASAATASSTTSVDSQQPEPKAGGGGAAPPAAVSNNPLPLLVALKSHTRPIERLAYFPILSKSTTGSEDAECEKTGKIGLISTDSMGVLKIWELEKGSTSEGQAGRSALTGAEKCSVRHHELAIYDLVVGTESGDIWTASADNSILLSSFSPSAPSEPPVPTLRIPHPTQTRSVLPLHLSYPNLPYLVTSTTSPEDLVRIFHLDNDALEPDAKREVRREWRGIAAPPTHNVLSGPTESMLPGCVREVEGHSNDVVSVATYVVENEHDKKNEVWIVSASLDGTLRRWNWKETLEQKREKLVLVEVAPPEEEEKESLLTEEEERELEALMADEDD